jgi:hypothetical protein
LTTHKFQNPESKIIWNDIEGTSPPYTYTILLKGKWGEIIAGYKDLDETFHELRREDCGANDNELSGDWVVAWAPLPTEQDQTPIS